MKISDKIRKWADDLDSDDIVCATATLYFLADRIDSEMVELPKDADGVPIHIGDTVWGCSSGMKVTIGELRMANADRWTAITTSGGHILRVSEVTHERPDSLKDIADELDEMVDAARSADDGCEKLADLAERIRKLAKKEGQR